MILLWQSIWGLLTCSGMLTGLPGCLTCKQGTTESDCLEERHASELVILACRSTTFKARHAHLSMQKLVAAAGKLCSPRMASLGNTEAVSGAA